jgi:hypothetical protein
MALASALAPDSSMKVRGAQLEQDRIARVKAQADFANGLMNDEQRWTYLSERGLDPTKPYAEDVINNQRRAERSRIPGYD